LNDRPGEIIARPAAEEWRRLHPSSAFFTLAGYARSSIGPLVAIAVLGNGLAGLAQSAALAPLIFIAFAMAVAQYWFYGWRLDEDRLVIRDGILRKNERRIPRERIQNIDLVQNLIHRMAGVAVARIETAGGDGAEATLNVLSLAEIDELETWLALGREALTGGESQIGHGSDGDIEPALESSGAPVETLLVGGRSAPSTNRRQLAAATPTLLLQVPTKDLALVGLGSRRGTALAAAGFGLLWELSWQFDIEDRVDLRSVWSLAEDTVGAIQLGGLVSLLLSLLAVASLLGLLQLLSVVWTMARFHDFRLERIGTDVRTRFGLFTRRTATVPRHRIQTLTLLDTPLLRKLGRTRISIKTAGSAAEGGGQSGPLWLAPIVKRDSVDALLMEAAPDLMPAMTPERWQPLHPNAERRLRKRGAIIALILFVPISLAWWGFDLPARPLALPLLLVLLTAYALIGARLETRYTGWAMVEGCFVVRRGWWTRSQRMVRLGKVQAASLHESPFDRRHGMASLLVDTAGRGGGLHRMALPSWMPISRAISAIGFWIVRRRRRFAGRDEKRGATSSVAPRYLSMLFLRCRRHQTLVCAAAIGLYLLPL
jgi:putative membrane protein